MARSRAKTISTGLQQSVGGPLRPSASRDWAIERQSLADQLRAELLRRILDGAIRPGERIIELRVAEEFGTSQAPVREALRGLEALGVVEVSRNRGARARVLDSRELAEISDVRAELEAYAAGLSAPSFKDDTTQLEAHLAAMQEAAKRHDVRAFAEANAEFHRLIVYAAGNATLLDIWSLLDVKAHTVMNVLRSRRELSRVAQSHVPIIEALNAGNARAARRATRAHVLENRLTTSIIDNRSCDG